MWQLFSLGAVVSSALEETIDKAAVLGSQTLDTVVATWIRNLVVFGIALTASIVIQHSVPSLIVSTPLIAWGFVYAAQAILWTWVLKNVEVTAIAIPSAVLPAIFLPIDLYVRHDHLTPMQILGICILVLGSIVFFMRKNITGDVPLRKYIVMVASVIVIDGITFGAEGYLFKNVYEQTNLAPSSFLVSGMFSMCAFLTLAVAFQWLRTRGQLSFAGALRYARGSTLAKVADYGTIYFTLQALTLVSLSQVSAMKAFQPLVLLGVALLLQGKFDIELKEEFSHDTLVQKVIGMSLVVIGSLLIR